MKKVYLAGQFKEHDDWKDKFVGIGNFNFYDPETDSNQDSSKNFFPEDLKAVSESDILIANPGVAPSEGTWIEIGYFLALNSAFHGDRCKKLIIIWEKDRLDWSLEFVREAGIIVESVDEALKKLKELNGEG